MRVHAQSVSFAIKAMTDPATHVAAPFGVDTNIGAFVNSPWGWRATCSPEHDFSAGAMFVIKPQKRKAHSLPYSYLMLLSTDFAPVRAHNCTKRGTIFQHPPPSNSSVYPSITGVNTKTCGAFSLLCSYASRTDEPRQELDILIKLRCENVCMYAYCCGARG